jgi:two-component system, NarL family, sensor histidine kinase BarA
VARAQTAPVAPRAQTSPIPLSRLLTAHEWRTVCSTIAAATHTTLAVVDRDGWQLGGPVSEAAAKRDLLIGGERIGTLLAEGAAAENALTLTETLLAAVLRQAQLRLDAAAEHEQEMAATIGELNDKRDRLERAVRRLEELDRLKSNFLANMSHELRTPLTSIIGYAEMLSEGLAGSLSAEQRDYVHTILGKADQLLGLISAVLDASSLESGQLSLDRMPITLAQVVKSEVTSFAAVAHKRGLSIGVDAEIEGMILGDRKKLRQVVSGLLSNAIKFTPDRGRVEVTIRSGPLVPGDANSAAAVHLAVADSGIGISRQLVPQIFEPFYQVDSSSTRAFGGSGVGLTLVKAYVEAHGGTIWVDSDPGAGATFLAIFPAA